ncbi:acetyl esterase/lipase [Litorivivens lipolytica]|uniref:Acetyl esterase/lipase n=1 Tax=Litorivivens lipolytica TaxID=1524264 RepID=A0A7W4Z7E6_9GAMM|nr:alpha/beta hydrolase [Litorivivens lipolytica]MBB3047945.1 acetyl esterase/lipase [Litorivivens lipolytica]
MHLDQVHPEIQRNMRWMPTIPVHLAPVRWLVAKLAGMMPGFKGDDDIAVEWINHNHSQSKLYRPRKPQSDVALLWIHGGGYLFGHANQDDKLVQRIIKRLGITVISAHYRMAPADKFPAALDDCAATWRWLQANAADLGIDPKRVIIGGQSAGGGLTAALAQRLYDEGGVQPMAQLLFCPMLDDRTVLRNDLTEEKHFIWNNRSNRAGWQCYLGQEPGLPDVPEHSVPARRKSLAGLPPAWLGVGSIDLFADEDYAYAERLQADGVECELYVTKGGPHAYESFFPDTEMARAHWESVFQFIERIIR